MEKKTKVVTACGKCGLILGQEGWYDCRVFITTFVKLYGQYNFSVVIFEIGECPHCANEDFILHPKIPAN